MKSILEVLESGSDYLQKRGVEEARLNMQLLLCHVLGCSRLELYLNYDKPLEEAQLAQLRELLLRRSRREPLQHILGSAHFYGREFACDGRGLIPRPETEVLVEWVLECHSAQSALQIADVGCGSGIIGVTLALELKQPQRPCLIDLKPAALDLSRENALKHAVAVELLCSDLLQALPEQRKFDVIVANLPYIDPAEQPTLAEELRYDPASALYADKQGLALIERLIATAASHLHEGGSLYLEFGWQQQPKIAALFAACPQWHELEFKADLAGIVRFCHAKKSPASATDG